MSSNNTAYNSSGVREQEVSRLHNAEIHAGIHHVEIRDYELPPDLAELLRNTRVVHGSDLVLNNRSSDHVVLVGKFDTNTYIKHIA